MKATKLIHTLQQLTEKYGEDMEVHILVPSFDDDEGEYAGQEDSNLYNSHISVEKVAHFDESHFTRIREKRHTRIIGSRVKGHRIVLG